MKVFYTERMVAESESFSPSAHKPREVMKSWQALGLPLEIVEPEAVTIDQLVLAHDRSFVEDVLSCRRDNGFGNRSAAVAASLPYNLGGDACGCPFGDRRRRSDSCRFIVQQRGMRLPERVPATGGFALVLPMWACPAD